MSSPGPTGARPDHGSRDRHGHHWMMLVCCIPMLGIAIALIASGVVGSGFLFAAVGCTVMMYLMMRSMPKERNPQ